jgi:hypothetical protein
MIEVKNNRIYFYNANKRDIIPVDFQCMSAYVCPHCKKLLAAYYAGKIVELEAFLEDPSLKHHYMMGASNGGQYLLLDDSQHKKGCKGWDIVSLSARGIIFSIEIWAKRNGVVPENLQKLCAMIAAGEVQGFEIVQDNCGADDPIVLYNEHEFISMNNPEFNEYFMRRDNLGDYVEWLAAGDHSKPFEPPIKPTGKLLDVPEGDLQSLADIEVT